MEYLNFYTLENQLVSECGPDYTPKNQLLLCQRSNFNEWAQNAYLFVPSGDGIFYSVLCFWVLFTYYRGP